MVAVVSMIGYAGVAYGQINVFVDFTNFETRLDEATTSAGVANFDATERATIQTNILNSLGTVFTGYTVNFTTTNPGGTFETLNFGLTGGGFGLADRIDFRNLFGTDVARVFTANFGTFLSAGDSRAVQITKLSNSLAGTAAHEVGHNVGLEHRDPYGIAGIGSANANGGHGTGGLQNTHLMATGITGLTSAQRVVPRSFSDLSHVKLEFANGLVPNPIATIQEQGGPHSTAATAQHVSFTDLAIGNSGHDKALAVEGTISANGQLDFYSFDLLFNEFATFQIISQVLFSNDIDSLITLFDSDGTTILVSNDDTVLSSTAVNQGGSTYSRDSSIYNFQAPRDDTYFLRVAAVSNSDTGFYELLIASTSLAVIPEPGAAFIVTALIGFSLLKRRRVIRR